MKVKELLCSKDKWCKGAMAKDKAGKSVSFTGRKAVRFCLLGAIYRCYKTSEKRATVFLKLLAVIGPYVTRFNDKKETTFSDIKKVVSKVNI